jgi:hypothetical protein
VDAIKLSVGFWHHVVNMAESYFIKQQFDFWTIPSRTIYNSIINLSDQTCTLWINNMMPKTYRKFNTINRVGKMCVAAMSLCMIVLIVTRKRGDGRYYFALWRLTVIGWNCATW